MSMFSPIPSSRRSTCPFEGQWPDQHADPANFYPADSAEGTHFSVHHIVDEVRSKGAAPAAPAKKLPFPSCHCLRRCARQRLCESTSPCVWAIRAAREAWGTPGPNAATTRFRRLSSIPALNAHHSCCRALHLPLPLWLASWAMAASWTPHQTSSRRSRSCSPRSPGRTRRTAGRSPAGHRRTMGRRSSPLS